MGVTPRTYQKAAVKAALAGLRSRLRRALVVLATGLGKTLTVAFITREFRPKKVLFLVHNNFILKHAMDEFRLVFNEKTKMVTYNGMSRNGAHEADIVFATWQTMGKSLKQWARNHFDLIIVDEAHHSEADTWKPALAYFTGPKLGITATPDREDEADIREVFGPEVINITLEEAIARGWLPRIEYHVITDESLDENALQKIAAEIREGKKRFTMAEVNRRIFIRKRDVEIARIINGYNEKTLVFCASILHAERLSKSLKLAATFHSEKGENQRDTWKQNQETLEALKNGTIRRVCAVNAFNEGVNVPSIGLVAFCRVTGVLTIFRQQLGRGLRPGKDKLVVLDFVGNLERIQLVLEMMNKISDLHEQFTPRGEIEREGYIRERFEVSGKGFEFTFSDKVVDLMKILEHCEQEFYPTWQEAALATEKLNVTSSRAYFRQFRIDPRLPRQPHEVYADFPGWGVFLGTGRMKRRRAKNAIYLTVAEASRAAQVLGITTGVEYRKRYKEDPRLPGYPPHTYEDFPGWGTFLGTGSVCRRGVVFYDTWQEASAAAVKLEIKSQAAYRTRGEYKRDPKLTSEPQRRYKDFPGWDIFLKKTHRVFYSTWEEAREGALKLDIENSQNYPLLYKKDNRLPAKPDKKYPDFPSWPKFLGKK